MCLMSCVVRPSAMLGQLPHSPARKHADIATCHDAELRLDPVVSGYSCKSCRAGALIVLAW